MNTCHTPEMNSLSVGPVSMGLPVTVSQAGIMDF